VKFAFSTLACPRWSTEQIVENAIQMGYDAIELRLLDGEVLDPIKDAAKIEAAISLARGRGLEVCALDTSCTLNQSKPEVRAQQVAALQNWIRLAQNVQVPLLRVFGGKGESENAPQDENAWVVECLNQVRAEAEQAGVKIVLETHDAFSSARRVAEILAAIESPAIGVLWDSHHPYRVGESAEEVMDLLGKRVYHAHVKDARLIEPEKWQLVLVGEGEVQVRDQLRLLHQHNYDGYISVEWEKRWHPEIEEPEVALPQHIAWLKQVEREL
jgi:sugar phosphate isomerase/epimerase